MDVYNGLGQRRRICAGLFNAMEEFFCFYSSYEGK